LRALVRPPGESFRHAISEQQPRPAIDVTLAREQHAAYCKALRAAGLDLIELPPDKVHPDACFVQDAVVVFGDLGVITHFGVRSRQGEQDAVSQALRGHKRLEEVRSPATLEGGHVLMAGSRVFVDLFATHQSRRIRRAARPVGTGESHCRGPARAARAASHDVLTVSLSEFTKADGGVTCLALPC
jgi:N-dimethylarginine dimethylaminohydrolase